MTQPPPAGPPVPPPGPPPPGGWPIAPYGAGGGAPQPARISVGAVIGGVVLGAALNFGWLFLVVVVGSMGAGVAGTGSPGPGRGYVGLVIVVAALPLVIAIAMMFFRKTRQLGAGLMIGVAIEAIVGAGLCAAPWVLLSQSGA